MSKHTPGPWKDGGCVVWQHDGDQVCDLSESRRSANEIEANARLISAAPDLLEACKIAEEQLRNLAREFLGGGHPDSDTTQAINKLRAAIAKAEGRRG